MAKTYKTIAVGVSKANEEKHDALLALSKKLNCKPSALIWDAIRKYLDNAPTTAPVGAAPSAGSAPGFWVIPVMGDAGAEGVRVVEVESRPDGEGRSFFRYKAGDSKGRRRALGQAKRAAQFDCQLIGINFDEDEVELLDIEDDEGSEGSED